MSFRLLQENSAPKDLKSPYIDRDAVVYGASRQDFISMLAARVRSSRFLAPFFAPRTEQHVVVRGAGSEREFSPAVSRGADHGWVRGKKSAAKNHLTP